MRSFVSELKRADAKLAFAGLGLSFVFDARHEKAEAIQQMSSAFKALDTTLPKDAPDVLAEGILGDDAARARALDLLHRYLDSHPPVISGVAVYALIRMGEPARALATIQQGLTSNDAVFLAFLWNHYSRDVRTLPEFPEFVRKMGLADVWDQYGPPDDCHRVAPRDYICE